MASLAVGRKARWRGGGSDVLGQAGDLLYDYLDTSQIFLASTLHDTKALFNPDPAAKHETVMYAAAAIQVLFGGRDGSRRSSVISP